MCFERLSETAVRHEEGYVVQRLDRFKVEYLDADIGASVSVESGPAGTTIYRSTLGCYRRSENAAAVTKELRQVVLDRIIAGVSALTTFHVEMSG